MVRPRLIVLTSPSGNGDGGSTNIPPKALEDTSAEGGTAIDSARFGTVGSGDSSAAGASDFGRERGKEEVEK